MKNSSQKGNSQQTPPNVKSTDEGDAKNKDFNSPEAMNVNMTEQYVIPPSRVWEKIEKILDEQDDRRKDGSIIITNSFKSKEKKVQTYLAAFAGVTLLAGLIWAFS